MNVSIINSFCYTLGWFWCVLFGINSHPIIAASGALFLVILQIYYIKLKSTKLYIQDFILMFFSSFLGIILELIFVHTSLINYVESNKFFPPIWIILLYPLFSLLLNHSLAVIKRNYILAFIFGFLGAPLSYFAGKSLGGLTFYYSATVTWIMIGVLWGLFLIILSKIANLIEAATIETLKNQNSTEQVDLLYDGDCPICNREVCVLKKKANKNLKFINIASKDYVENSNHLNYETAMSQIHLVDSEGNFLIGLDAFATTYARCNMLVTSTLIRLSFLRIFLNPLYAFFAKNRLRIAGRDKKN